MGGFLFGDVILDGNRRGPFYAVGFLALEALASDGFGCCLDGIPYRTLLSFLTT